MKSVGSPYVSKYMRNVSARLCFGEVTALDGLKMLCERGFVGCVLSRMVRFSCVNQSLF